MSGRTVWFRDNGERVTGHRKTNRRNPRRALPAGPGEYRLVFILPPEARAFTSNGTHGHAVVNSPNVTVTSWARDLTFDRVAEFMQAIGKGHERLHTSGVLQTIRNDDSRDGARDTVQISYHKGAVQIWYGASSPYYVPAKR